MNARVSGSPVLIWHILKKDLKLLWPFCLGALACQVTLVILRARAEPFGPTQEIGGAVILLSILLVMGITVLILTAVQQDPIPGTGQDWLARPIPRRDLLLAKLLFVLLVIHSPILVTGLLHGLWDGFSFGESLEAALSMNLYLLLVFSLPLMTIGALTRNVTEAVVGAVALSFGIILVLLLLASIRALFTHTHHLDSVTLGTALGWVSRTVSLGVLLVAMAAVLTMQYARRMTWTARTVFSVALLVSLLLLALPWRPALEIQAWLSPNPSADRTLSVVFDPSWRARSTPGTAQSDAAQAIHDSAGIQPGVNLKESQVETPEEVVTLFLPLRLSGVPAGSLLSVDRTELRVVDEGGNTLYQGGGEGVDLIPSPLPEEAMMLRAGVRIPAAIYRHLMDRPVRLEVEEALTLLHARALPPLPALGGDRHLAGVGRCAARVDDTGTAIEVGCIAAGEWPACTSVLLALSTGERSPAVFRCSLDYAPWRAHLSLDAISRSHTRLAFRDPSGRAHNPVGEAQLRDAQVILTVYQPFDHFLRSLTVPRIRLRDLETSAVFPAGPARVAPDTEGH